MPKYFKYEERRQMIANEVGKKHKRGIILIISAIPFLFLISFFEPIILVSIILVIIAIVNFVQATKKQEEYRVIVKNNIIKDVISERLDNVTYEANNHLSIDRINNTGLLRRPDRIKGEDRVVASYKGVGIESSDFTLLERVVRTDSKGNQVVTYEPYFKGRWIVYSFNKHFDEVLKVIEGRPFNSRGLFKVSTESIVFNKKFDTRATSEHFAFYHITPLVLEKLLELEEMHKGRIMYCIMNNELHVGINDNRNYFELSLKQEITAESLKPLYSEIDLIAAIINELKLDSPKYNN